MQSPQVMSVHERILQRTLQNAGRHNIHVKVTNLQSRQRQIGKYSQTKICIDLHSMLKYFIENLIEGRHYPSVEYILQQSQQIKQVIDKVNCMIFGISEIFSIDDITIIFPEEEHFRVDNHYQGHLQRLVKQLLSTEFKEERKKSEHLFSQQQKIYELNQIIYNNIGFIIRNPYTASTERSLSEESQVETQLQRVIMKIKVPWLNNSIFLEDPCAMQLSYFASLGYMCFSWNPACINYVPVGAYKIGFKAETFIPLAQQSLKIIRLQEHVDSQKQNEILKDMKTSILSSQYIEYSFDGFIEKIQKQENEGTYFRTDQVFLSVLLPYSHQLDLSQRILKQIRNGTYSIAGWMAHKIFTRYLMIQLHPIVVENQTICKVQNKHQFKIVFQSQLKNSSLEEQKKVLKMHSEKALFIHVSFQSFLAKYISKQLQKVQNVSSWNSPSKKYKDKIQTKRSNINSTSQTDGQREMEAERIRTVSKSLFINNYHQFRMMDNRFLRAIQMNERYQFHDSDSDIDEQY